MADHGMDPAPKRRVVLVYETGAFKWKSGDKDFVSF